MENNSQYMRRVRRHIHQNPEVSGMEHRTAQYIANELRQLGLLPVFIAQTGVYADLIVNDAYSFLAYRADTDALPIQEKNNMPYRSQILNIMHACGHDGHVAMLLGFARAAVQNTSLLKNNIRFIFQPAEETGGGAASMIQRGVLSVKPAAVFAIHLWPALPFGTVGLKDGEVMASNDRFSFQITGRPAHAAMRHLGIDALAVGANILSGINLMQAAICNPSDGALIFVGQMNAGSCYNIVADICTLTGTVRVFDQNTRTVIQEKMLKLAEGTELATGASCQLEYIRQYPVTCNDSGLYARLTQLSETFAIRKLTERYMTAEDFAFYGEQSPSFMILLGTGTEENNEPLHSDRFDFDESILNVGSELFFDVASSL